MSSPLILGFDLGNDTEYARWFPIVSNPLALRIQSSWAGLAGRLVQVSGRTFRSVVPHGCTCEDMKDTRDIPTYTVWGKPMSKSAWALTAINSVQGEQMITVQLADLGLSPPLKVTDVWTGETTFVGAAAAGWNVSLAPAGAPGGHRFVLLEEYDA